MSLRQLNRTKRPAYGCGSRLDHRDGVVVAVEHPVGLATDGQRSYNGTSVVEDWRTNAANPLTPIAVRHCNAGGRRFR
ncbi:hypothetical protein D3C73_1556970 [compost metagenome]